MTIIKNVMEMTWVEIEALDKEKTVLFVTIAPIEEHSRHLPLGTDIYEGERWRNDTISILRKKLPDFNFLYLPAFPIACAGAVGFYGNIYFKQRTVRNIVCELLENIVTWKINNIVIIASHADPTHLIAVEEACSEINKRFGVCAFSPMGALFSAQELGIDTSEPEEIKSMTEQYPNDFHAGWIETSNMLDIDSTLVGKDYKELPDTYIEAKEMISAEKVLAAMDKCGHLGYPRLADKKVGTLLNENAAKNLSKAVTAFVQRNNWEKYEHHFLYKLPFLRTDLSE
ncbi:creatininase family protein [Clostridium oryzae]|uniref:Creatinine amidohydrolase n=1 Tax=Clostridium oryzae TaxID=1450648 RepID=A0A1V4IE51_9CLOT|nr:creatininase family protein [Clostridium oryzae]OPJ58206.1 creatinine amidohydrolase [Clostridium oryzae]